MQLESLAERIEAAGLGLESWDMVVGAMVASLPGTIGAIHSLDRRDGRCNFNAGAGLPPESARLYVDHYSALNPWRPLLDRWPVGRLMSTSENCPVEAFAKTEFVQDWLEPLQKQSVAIGVKLDADGRDLMNFHIHLPGRFLDRLRPMVEKLVRSQIGPLQQALRVNRLLSDRFAHSVAAAALVARSQAVAFVVDRGLRLVEANEAADLAFAAATLLTYRTASPRFLDDRTQAWFEESVAALQARRTPSTQAWHLQRGGGYWRVSLAAIPEFDPRIDSRWMVQRRLVLVIIDDLSRPPDSRRLEAALQPYGLTPAELRLCHRLAEGLTLHEAAERLALKRETVRHRLKSIFTKTDTRRQVDLVLLLSRLS